MLIGLFVISACRSLPFQPAEKSLKQRIAGMMTARENQDWAKVYKFLDPDYKKQVSKQGFLGINRNIEYKDFTIESVEFDPSGKKATAQVKYDMTVQSFDVKDHRETLEWVKSGGSWYFKMPTGSVMD